MSHNFYGFFLFFKRRSSACQRELTNPKLTIIIHTYYACMYDNDADGENICQRPCAAYTTRRDGGVGGRWSLRARVRPRVDRVMRLWNKSLTRRSGVACEFADLGNGIEAVWPSALRE